MKSEIIFCLVILFAIVASCKPSPSVRSKIRQNKKSLCRYPLSYKSSLNREVVKDSINLHQTGHTSGSDRWVDEYEHIKTVYHTFSAENGLVVRGEVTSETIIHQNGELKFEYIFNQVPLFCILYIGLPKVINTKPIDMDFKDQLKQIADKFIMLKDSIKYPAS